MRRDRVLFICTADSARRIMADVCNQIDTPIREWIAGGSRGGEARGVRAPADDTRTAPPLRQ